MTITDDIAAALPRLRDAAESMMVDTCTITSEEVRQWDADTNTYADSTSSSIYAGPCQVQLIDSITVTAEGAGEQQIVTERVVVKIPTSAPSVPIDSVLTITATGLTSDPALVGRRYRVAGSHAKTFATSRRLPCVQVTA